LQVTSNRIDGIEGLRGWAVLMIVFFHYITTAIDPSSNIYTNALFRLTHYFNSGVDLFFVISGFLITRNLCSSGITRDSVKRYVFRRACRILPLYYLGLVACAVIFYWGLGLHTAWYYSKEIPWFSYLIFLQNEWMAWNGTMGSRLLSIYWSLGIEMQFYFMIPWILYLLRRNGRIIFCVGAIIMAIVFRAFDGTLVGSYTHFYCRMDALFAGSLIALVSMESYNMKLLARISSTLNMSALILLLLSVGVSLNLLLLSNYMIPSFFVLIYSIFLVLQIVPNGAFFGFLNHALFRFLGRYSFGIYITHEIIRFVIFQLLASGIPQIAGIDDVLYTILSFVITILVSVMIYHLLEKKFLTMKI